jgi:uncharacterized protein with von Willebrand factor type A (vWA) domain
MSRNRENRNGDNRGRNSESHENRNRESRERDGPFAGTGGDSNAAIDAPDVVAARDRVVATLLEFTRELERAGADVSANASVDAARALVEIGFGSEDRARAALKATLVSRAEDVGTFDRLFEVFWRRLTEHLSGFESAGADNRENVGGFAPIGADPDVDRHKEGDPTETADDAADDEESAADPTNWRPATRSDDAESEDGEDDPIRTALYSPTGRSERLVMPAAALAERESLDRAIERLTRALATVRGRRWAAGGDDRADARRALRRSFSTGGTVVSIPQRERTPAGVRCALFVDVSRSVLDAIDRAFLIRFLRAATAEWHATQTFLFDTDVREVSAELATPTPEATVRAFDRAEAEWGGGTRIAEALSSVRHEHPNAIDRRTAVFVISDGLEMGDIEALEAEMNALSRRAGVVLWGNPLAGAPEYEPTARGMAASLPYVDGLFAFRRADDVAEIARQIERRGTTAGAIGYAYDPRRRARE